MKKKKKKATTSKGLRFADVFAGCGGLSLGLINAGWRGQFAIEKSPDAFNTLASNLIRGKVASFEWPEWLPQKALTTAALLADYKDHLSALEGEVDLLAGGPPCQGFSLAGRRIHSDPRNSLTEEYIEIVEKIKPRLLLIENVQGFTLPFKKNGEEKEQSGPYSAVVTEMLEAKGYKVFSDLVDLSKFGVPQTRKRFILIAIRHGDSALEKLKEKSPFDLIYEFRKPFLESKGLPTDKPISVKAAIGDLETKGKKFIDSTDYTKKGFKQIDYQEVSKPSGFISLMRKNTKQSPDSLRLPHHKAPTIARFQAIMDTCKAGQTVGEKDRSRLGIKKHALTPLHPRRPSGTITTLPDDIIHYSEPRILTVRENARLQTFPDWFQFTGKYTTGGANRRHDCPRYTQVGNAVPPLFSEALGLVLKKLAS